MNNWCKDKQVKLRISGNFKVRYFYRNLFSFLFTSCEAFLWLSMGTDNFFIRWSCFFLFFFIRRDGIAPPMVNEG